MMERYGIVTRETVLAEGVPGGFSTLYSELGNLELLGTARRGYFVEGLGGAQFALPGAVERLRSLPEPKGEYLVLAATDPANPYGASLPWPKLEGGRRPGRTPGSYLLLRDGASRPNRALTAERKDALQVRMSAHQVKRGFARRVHVFSDAVAIADEGHPGIVGLDVGDCRIRPGVMERHCQRTDENGVFALPAQRLAKAFSVGFAETFGRGQFKVPVHVLLLR